MSGKIEVIKKTHFDFDADYALMEAESVEKVFALHLERCNDEQTADTLSNIFFRLGRQFEQKKFDLTENVN